MHWPRRKAVGAVLALAVEGEAEGVLERLADAVAAAQAAGGTAAPDDLALRGRFGAEVGVEGDGAVDEGGGGPHLAREHFDRLPRDIAVALLNLDQSGEEMAAFELVLSDELSQLTSGRLSRH